jgi:hypothetical protein
MPPSTLSTVPVIDDIPAGHAPDSIVGEHEELPSSTCSYQRTPVADPGR